MASIINLQYPALHNEHSSQHFLLTFDLIRIICLHTNQLIQWRSMLYILIDPINVFKEERLLKISKAEGACFKSINFLKTDNWVLKWCNPGWLASWPWSQLEYDRCWSLFVSSHHFTPVWIVIFITAGVGMTYRYTMGPSAQHPARHQPHNNITNGLDQNLTPSRTSLLFPLLTFLNIEHCPFMDAKL